MEAINWAIDRSALLRASGYLGGERTDQILPPAMGREASIYPSARSFGCYVLQPVIGRPDIAAACKK